MPHLQPMVAAFGLVCEVIQRVPPQGMRARPPKLAPGVVI